MHSSALYMSAVLIWGSTFFAIKFQLGEVPVELSIAYRFALAALILFGWCRARGLPLGFGYRQHLWMLAQGVMLFCLNYLVIYWATFDLTSGLIAVIFSTIVLMNIANNALFFGKPIDRSVLVGALMGLAGISFVFWPELSGLESGSGTLNGILLSLLGTYFASLGNVISARNQRHGLPVVQTMAFGMAYGSGLLALFALAQGLPFSYEPTAAYSLSLVYLAVFGSVLAFGSFLTLLGRIGPEKAAYSMVLFPLVALGISTVFEDYHWSAAAIGGVILVLMGNVVIIMSSENLARLLRALRGGTS